MEQIKQTYKIKKICQLFSLARQLRVRIGEEPQLASQYMILNIDDESR
jgi:hypothetical protein